MKDFTFKKAGLKNSQLLEKEEMLGTILDRVNESENKRIHIRKKFTLFYKVQVSVAVLLLFLLCTASVYACSSDFRHLLAEKLNINGKDVHVINKTYSDNGITMKIVSSRITEETATILLTFKKDNGDEFNNSLSVIEGSLEYNDLEHNMTAIESTLTEDYKTIFCYLTLTLTDFVEGQIGTIRIKDLICNESIVAGKTYQDEKGEWTLDFELFKDNNNDITFLNPNISQTISMCHKRLQVNSATLSDTLVIVNTTTLEEDSDTDFNTDAEIYNALHSPYSMSTGGYYDVFIELVYQDGSITKNGNSSLDEKDNIVAWFPKSIAIEKLKEIRIGDIIIPVE